MKLLDLFGEYPCTCVKGNMNLEITDIAYDSRKASEGMVFVCLAGANFDGHGFISQVAAKGVKAVVVEREIEVKEGVCVVRVDSTRKALAYMSAAYFGHPGDDLIKIGLTGTKGKTTTSYMIKGVLDRAGKKTGLIGSIGALIGEKAYPMKNTTPESYEIHKMFREMVEEGCEYVVMEVSSQGLKQGRVAGIQYEYGIFTNFSPDHIGKNEHSDLNEYLFCKSLLFRQCKVGLMNRDDEKWEEVLKDHVCAVKTFACNERADLMAEDIRFVKENGKLGMRFRVKGRMKADVTIYIPGRFNVYNALVTILTCLELGVEAGDVVSGLKDVQIRGRVELVPVSDDYTVIIDHAHNEVSTRSVINTVKEYHPNRIVCVYGAGGNRSKLRRYDVGEVAGKLADLSVVTSDNPRDEEVLDIIEDIKVGLARSNGNYIVIPDRKEAIAYALQNAKKEDVILLLGKGHEDYQEVKGVKYPFDERLVIREIMEKGHNKNISLK